MRERVADIQWRLVYMLRVYIQFQQFREALRMLYTTQSLEDLLHITEDAHRFKIARFSG